MAEDAAKEEPKDKLKFFKRAKEESAEPVKADEAKEVQAENQEAEKPASARAKDGQAQTADRPEEETGKAMQPRMPLMPLLAPSLALAVRTLVILAIIVADAYAAYFLVVKGIAPRMAEAQVIRMKADVTEPEEPPEPAETETGTEEAGYPRVGTITAIEDIVVNPSGTSGTRYLCTTVALESVEPLVADEINERELQIRDLLIEILGKHTVEDLSSLQSREGIRGEIKSSVNNLLSTGEVVGVYFSNFVLQ